MKVLVLYRKDDRIGEYLQKGFRNNIYVFTNDAAYCLELITVERIVDDIIIDVNSDGYYTIDENCIVMNSIDDDSVKCFFSSLNDCFFRKFTRLSHEEKEFLREQMDNLYEL